MVQIVDAPSVEHAYKSPLLSVLKKKKIIPKKKPRISIWKDWRGRNSRNLQQNLSFFCLFSERIKRTNPLISRSNPTKV